MWVGECMIKQSFIQQGIVKYIEFWKLMMERDVQYVNEMLSYVFYWECIYLEIIGLFFSILLLFQEGFWFMIDWQRDYVCSIFLDVGFEVIIDIIFEDDFEFYLYC